MSDAQKLKDCISELEKANKTIKVQVKKAAEKTRQARQESGGQSSRQN